MSKIKELYLAGLRARIKEHDDREKAKTGTLRGGNSGIITEGGIAAGACGRLTYLRAKGINPNPIEEERELMFAAGRSNEDSWLDALKRSYDGPILCEEEIPTHWITTEGTPVTGRPDIVLGKDDGVATEDTKYSYSPDEEWNDGPARAFAPHLGIELKLVSSLWTARTVLIEDTPKIEHLIQSAHYSWQLDCPFELWYTSRADYHIGSGWDRDWETTRRLT